VLVGICFFLVLTACSPKDAEDVVQELQDRSESMESYISHGKLVIHTGQKPQEIDVEVWYKKPNYYRVALKNKDKNITQILLKNDEGVYVITPHLKKSYRFQSDWPATSGQVYIYQTILKSIIDDPERQFSIANQEYRFDVAPTMYMHRAWAKQRVYLDQEFLPKKVDVFDENNQLVLSMTYDRFQLNASFDKDAFDTKRNMETPEGSKETVAQPQQREIEAVTPGYIPDGTQLVDEQTITTDTGPMVIMRFKGKQSFTLTQRYPVAVEASSMMQGNPVQIDDSLGVLLEMQGKKRLTWVQDGVEFELIGNLSTDEMKQIALSVADQPKK
jgi:outer membrane lipoprotein-sorting protein